MRYRVLGLVGVAMWLSGCVMPQMQETKVSEVVERPVSDLPTTGKARTSAKLHTELADAYRDASRLGVALDEVNKAINYDTGYAPAYMVRGQIYAELEQYELARPSFEEASRLAPGDPIINNAYGWFLCSQGQEKLGLQRLEMAARNPYYTKPVRAWTNAGLCYLRLKDDAQAEARFERAVAASDREPLPLFQLAAINLRQGRTMRAKLWIDQLMNLREPGSEELWLAIRIEKKLGNEVTVRQYAERLRANFPGSDEYQNYLQGKFE